MTVLLSRIIPILILCCSLQAFASDEVRKFDIQLAGVKIGELTAKRTIKDSLTYYHVESRVNFWLFVRVNVHHVQVSVYNKDKLISSSVDTKTTKGDFTARVNWDKDRYRVKVDSYKYKSDTTINTLIHFNVMRLFFEEPRNVKAVLADGNGVMAPVSFLKNTYFEVNVRGERNKYYFKDGALQRAVMDNAIKNYEIVLRKE